MAQNGEAMANFEQPSQWWQTGVIYQIYPRSFQDTTAATGTPDGIGDLPGITGRLDYLVALGVDAIWISPFYPSPMADFGYDVADYTGVDPLFGTIADFDMMLAAAHRKGLRVILDFVPNHTSSQHPWFLESRSSRNNPKRDWYLWHDPIAYNHDPAHDSRPISEQHPNNWQSQFGGPAWTWDEPTQQFYLHSFLPEQPDLNWRNPEVRSAMYAAMRFWLDKGVDGFRMDVLWLLIKDDELRNNFPGGPVYNADQPETHEIVAEMRALLDSYSPTSPLTDFSSRPESLRVASIDFSSRPESLRAASIDFSSRPERSAVERPAFAPAQSQASTRVLIGEIYLPLPELVRYYGSAAQQGTPHLNGANLPFNFHLLQSPWNAAAIAEIIRTYESLLPAGAWPNYVLGNHDQSRLASRIGPLQARAAAMLLLTLRGTPTLYYGDELGMKDVPIAPNQVRDPAEKNQPGQGKGRDPERSPMLWLNTPNAGFTTPEATPWLPLQQDWATENAAAQSRNPRSMLTLYRRLLTLRRLHDTLHVGAIAEIAAEGSILRYRRIALPDGESTDFQILLNLGNDVATTNTAPGTIVLTTLLDGEGSRVAGPVAIEAGEGLLIALD
jgi:alpha-glucosidase